MARNNNISDLFNPNGCLNQSTIAKFIDKRLDEKELQKVLSHLDACPLCKDAVEGISGVSADQFSEDINKLRTDFYAISSDKDKKHRIRLISIISAAASIIIVLGVLFLYQRIRLNTDNTIAQSVESGEEPKEKKVAGEESGPLNEAAEPAQAERKETSVTESESVDKAPVSEMDKEPVAAYESSPDISYAEMESAVYDQEAEPDLTEKSMELSEGQSVIVDIPLSASATVNKRSKSAVNAGLMKEDDALEAQTVLPARNVLFVEKEKPVFKGGDIQKFADYLQEQLASSEQLSNKIDTDSILISFVVDTLGRPVNIKIIDQIDSETEKEIIRLFRSSPDWLPGKENGIRINVGYNISVRIHPENTK